MRPMGMGTGMTQDMIDGGNAQLAGVAVVAGPAGCTTYMISYRGRAACGGAGDLPDGLSFTLSSTLMVLDRGGEHAVVPLSATITLDGAAQPASGGATILSLPARQA